MEIVNIYYSIIIQYASKNREGGGGHFFLSLANYKLIQPIFYIHISNKRRLFFMRRTVAPSHRRIRPVLTYSRIFSKNETIE